MTTLDIKYLDALALCQQGQIQEAEDACLEMLLIDGNNPLFRQLLDFIYVIQWKLRLKSLNEQLSRCESDRAQAR